MSDKISQDKIKINVARLKKFGNTFEINIDPDAAVRYRKGEITDLGEVLLADNIFSDAKKGQIAPNERLQEAFHTTDTTKIAETILNEGEVQATAEHRAEEREQKRRKLISMINKQAIDPKTGLPHPPNRIEAALEEGKIHIDYNRGVEEQFDDIISKLRPIIPISIEKKEVNITIPATYAGKAYGVVSSNSKMLQDTWNSDGSWTVKVEIPAGFYPEFLEKLNSLTHGEVIVEE